MENLFGQRLNSARKAKGLSMEKLAEEIQVSKQMISKYENGKSIPDSPNLIALAKALGRKVEFFFKPYVIKLSHVEFRKKASLSKKKEYEIKEKILSQVENYMYIEDILGIKSTFDKPGIGSLVKNHSDVDKIVDKLRKVWKIGCDPIHSVVELLESQEIKVIELDLDLKKFDGMSSWIDNKYQVIVVNENFTIERKRFTLLHELGHLLLNIDESLTDKEKENLCHNFAGSMLFPKEAVINEFGNNRKNISLQELEIIQQKYGISIQAILFRLLNCSIITKITQEIFYKKINYDQSLKEKVNKERFSGTEKSERYLQLVYRALSQENISISKASSLLDLSINKLKNSMSLI